jgi:hypothetical protein
VLNTATIARDAAYVSLPNGLHAGWEMYDAVDTGPHTL